MISTRGHGIPPRGVTTRVSLDRTQPEEAVFRYEIGLDGELTDEQKDRLFRAASACPVRRTLSRRIRFDRAPDAAPAAPTLQPARNLAQ